jgi:hypothetical protein
VLGISVSLNFSLWIFKNHVVTDTNFAYTNYESTDVIGVDMSSVRRMNWKEKN